MGTRLQIQQGDSIAKLAFQHGLAPETIWEDGDNASIRTERSEMNVLAPGDIVYIPDRRQGDAPCNTGLRHIFRRRGVPMLFQVELLDGRLPRANVAYVLKVDGVELSGTTDADGRIARYIPNDAREGRLSVDDGAVDVALDFGYMDPITSTTGLQKRLINLGFTIADEPGVLGGDTKTALRMFQYVMGLEETGEPDDRTKNELQHAHDEPGTYAAALAKASDPGSGD